MAEPTQSRPRGRTGRVGPFHLGGVLGRGSFGHVFAAWDPDLDAPCAVKVHPQTGRSLARFHREYLVMDRVDHPAVPTPLQLGALSTGGAWMAMTLAPGVSAADHVDRFGPPGSPARNDAVCALLVDVFAALAALHPRVVHCDLKSSNLRVDDDGRLTLLDFGGVDVAGTGRGLGRVYTRNAAALEQLAGIQVDPRTDVFGVGVLAWRLLTGERPFPDDAGTLLRRVEVEPPPPADRTPGVPAWLSDAVMSWMASDPGDRPPTAAAAADPLVRHGACGRGWPEPVRPAWADAPDPRAAEVASLTSRGALSAAEARLRAAGRPTTVAAALQWAHLHARLGRSRLAVRHARPLLRTRAAVDAACLLALVAETDGDRTSAFAALDGVTPATSVDAARLDAWRARLHAADGDHDAAARCALAAGRGLPDAPPAAGEEILAGIERVFGPEPLAGWSRTPGARLHRLDRLRARLAAALERGDDDHAAAALAAAIRLSRWVAAGLDPHDRAAWELRTTLLGLW